MCVIYDLLDFCFLFESCLNIWILIECAKTSYRAVCYIKSIITN